jgi:hypothetical protein
LRVLKELECKANYVDDLLVNIAVEKLDRQTQREWGASLGFFIEPPTLE